MEFARKSVVAIRALGETEKIILGALLVGMWFMTDLGYWMRIAVGAIGVVVVGRRLFSDEPGIAAEVWLAMIAVRTFAVGLDRWGLMTSDVGALPWLYLTVSPLIAFALANYRARDFRALAANSVIVMGVCGYALDLLGTFVFEALLPKDEARARVVQNAICGQWLGMFAPVFIAYIAWVLAGGTAQGAEASIESLVRKILTLRNIKRAGAASGGGFIAGFLLWMVVGAPLDRAQVAHALRNGHSLDWVKRHSAGMDLRDGTVISLGAVLVTFLLFLLLEHDDWRARIGNGIRGLGNQGSRVD